VELATPDARFGVVLSERSLKTRGGGAVSRGFPQAGSSAFRGSRRRGTFSSSPWSGRGPPVEPTLPATAADGSKAGAEAFIAYFWDLANYAQATGDTAGLRALGAESCGGCRGAFDFIDEVYGAGGSITGGEYTLGELDTERLVTNNDVVIFRSTFPTTNTRQVVRRPDKQAEVFEASTVRARFTLSYQPKGWQVDIWEVLG